MKILVINAGSSSIKYQLIDMITKQWTAKGLIERIGIEGGRIKHHYLLDEKKGERVIQQAIPDHETGLKSVAALLLDDQVGVIAKADEINAIGHRVVHGGERFSKTVIVTDVVKREIEQLIPLAPLHNGANLQGITVSEKVFPQATQVAVFDTSYHQSMPEEAFRYALSEHFYKEKGIRAYGFHGTSHKFVYQQAAAYLNNPHLKAISLHLGNGASMAAIDADKVKDTTMGMGPLAGLIMGTRSGDIDPSVLFYMNEELGLSMSEIKTILNTQSGLLGLTGSSDARDIETLYGQGDERATLAYKMMAYRIKKYIGAYTAVLDGIDALIFTGGIGENDALVRALACASLTSLGIALDAKANEEKSHASRVEEIQSAHSQVKILIVPTNEELQIANEAFEQLNNR